MNHFAKRIIPCLDVKDGRVVKGVNFVGLVDAGDPVEIAKFGSQCVVVAIDAKKIETGYSVFINGGRIDTKKDAFAWAKEVESRGAGEILLTSMDNDGVKQGFSLELTKIFSALSIPTIASGGAGKMEHFKDAFEAGADACLAASIFHFGEIEIKKLKEYLKANGIEVRL